MCHDRFHLCLTTWRGLAREVIPESSMAGVLVGLFFKQGGRLLAIDFVGTGREEGDAIPVTKSLVLKRSGVSLIPLGIDDW